LPLLSAKQVVLKKIIRLKPLTSSSDPGNEVITDLGRYVRSICKYATGPHPVGDRWDLNCKFHETELWLLIRRCESGLIIKLESAWDLRRLVMGRLVNPDFSLFESRLCDWKEQYSSGARQTLFPRI
jgi:hypothetical protein